MTASKAHAASRTNAMRALDRALVTYTPFAYDPGITSAVAVADALGVSREAVYKTLVMLADGRDPLLVMISGSNEVHPRVLARHIGAKAVRMAPKSEAERLTGLQTGGIGALSLLGRSWPVYIDRAALGLDAVYVNGGKRGLNLRLPPADLVRLTGAIPVDAL